VIPQRPEERVTRRDVEPAIGGVVAQRLGHGVGTLAVPLVRDLAARALVPQDAQRAGAVDDLGWWFTPKTRGIVPVRSRAASHIVTASPAAPSGATSKASGVTMPAIVDRGSRS
jgi:hypothetical protein